MRIVTLKLGLGVKDTILFLLYFPIHTVKVGSDYNVVYYNKLTPNEDSTNRRGLGSITGRTGSKFAQFPFPNTPTAANVFGIEANYRLSDIVILGGWFGYTNATAKADGVGFSQDDEADVWNWAVTAAFPDIGKRGSQLGFLFGMPPKATDNENSTREDSDTSYHIELFYRYPFIKRRIFFTPSVMMITNPEHDDRNDTIWLGIFRTQIIF